MDPNELNRWADALAAELGCDRDIIDIAAILDLARDAAHNVARPAAPLSTFIAGYVAGVASTVSDGMSPREIIERATAFALSWPQPATD
ncbi:MAG: hypothetical protein JWQ43_3120 [Glaciihabitans sp.]|nr:hypothetical protein [Glaciihabitans sp.]